MTVLFWLDLFDPLINLKRVLFENNRVKNNRVVFLLPVSGSAWHGRALEGINFYVNKKVTRVFTGMFQFILLSKPESQRL